MSDFDLAGPLPTETTLLEASAGTGKTYAIAALTTRYLAEAAFDVSDLLLITFGNHAAGELRSRVFGRLRETLRGLDLVAAGEPLPEPDPIVDLLSGVDGARARLADAIARFTEATIDTTHGFCQTMLRELGVLGDWDPTETVGPDPECLARECAADTYLRLFRAQADPPLSPRQGLHIGIAAATTTLPLLPHDGPHHEFAASVRDVYERRKRTEGLCTFDDITTRLRRALADKSIRDLVRSRLRERFPVVLVDEFQDTDPDQWEIIENAFVAPGRPTVLIGDPKQSIYGFRGADLNSYLAARRAATVSTLGTNHRSDGPLVQGIVDLFSGVTMGADEVVVGPVGAKHETARLDVPGSARVWLRRASGLSGSADEAIAKDVILQIQLLLAHEVKLSDIAVLMRTGRRAQQLRAALTEAGLPAVLTGSQAVWRQPAATHWLTLLTALADPRQANIRLASLTPLIGSEFATLLHDGGPEPARVSTLLRELAVAFGKGGAGAVLTHLRAAERLEERLLSEPDGDRLLADTAHLAELLDARGGSLSALTALLTERASGPDDDDAIRVATDAPSIRVMTMHAAKGLEFPIVLLPETDGTAPRRSRPFTLIEEGRRHLYIGPPPDWRDDVTKDLNQQSLAEELRLLYVGFTRAKHLAIAWHVDRANSTTTRSPLTHLLARRGWKPKRPYSTLTWPSGLVWDSRFADAPPPAPWAGPAGQAPPEMRAEAFDRIIDQTWRRTSYSGLTAGLHDAPAGTVADEPESLGFDTPLVDPVSVLGTRDSRREAPGSMSKGPARISGLDRSSPMADLPAGAGFGTLVHAVLERLDWAPDAVEAQAPVLVAELAPELGLTKSEAAQLAAALVDVCRTPLLPVSDLALTDLPVTDRLPELDFDLPLADAGAPATLTDLADLMAAWLPADDLLAPYPARLRASEAADAVLNGFLTGSIDAVLRLPDERYVVVDYKTNRLAPSAADDLTLAHYAPSPMAEAMMAAHYPLQAMLYCVALHRFLGSRLLGYDPARHLGGVGYLFVRGMAGAATPIVDGTSCGIFGWFPPAGLTVAASELLGGRRA
ncbi:MAG: UvrD-helicase domain-containing protein [Tessaracoccus sp.]|uniref:UvrD-helicase domain-containing protein n=1 Tax=Tessaracoccus sp. TaxID=1971211 RepID=UPI001ECD3C99|nr:UvrD-helicase domain-containing protein [Tessaracoccus sp.]MBK7821358.1 UvrD-helicase domain-containing protein [Tessaracoccus sp.]